MDSPETFAALISARLAPTSKPPPAPEVVKDLVLTAFYASLEREEHRSLQFALAYLDESELKDDHGGEDLWCPLRFASPLPLSVAHVVKLASANDPRRSVLAISGEVGALSIIGIVRTTGAADRASRSYEELGRRLPWSSLVVRATAPGTLTAFVGTDIGPSFLRGELLTTQHVPVFRGGMVWEGLYRLGHAHGLGSAYLPHFIQQAALKLVDRGQGGTLVVEATNDHGPWTGGHQIQPPSTNVRDAVRVAEGEDLARVRAFASVSRKDEPESDRLARVALEEKLARHDERRYVMEDATDFLADLASVDGAVILGPDFLTRAFGAKLTAPESTLPVVHVLSIDAKDRQDRSPIASAGTRHKSAASYCAASPGAFACVVSEDGPVSVLHRPPTERVVLVWRPAAVITHWPFPILTELPEGPSHPK